jgi:hypothetical protein
MADDIGWFNAGHALGGSTEDSSTQDVGAQSIGVRAGTDR